MAATEPDNRSFLTDLFAGPFRGHAIVFSPEMEGAPWPGDFTISERPVADWAPWHARAYEQRVSLHETLGDDAVPYAKLHTGTELFAAAFGCPVHVFEDSPACALPLVRTAQEADRIETPTLEARPLTRAFEMIDLLRERLGPDAPIAVPDIQSPFDIAALVWRKEDMFLALLEEPDAVKRLVGKCHDLLAGFLAEFLRRLPQGNLCHCPYAWAPPELGCWLSEDEAGSLSAAMFEEFCLPSLRALSEQFGGMFVHCCATADHQYENFRKIPNLRGLNRVFQEPGPRPAIEAFSGQTVLIQAWTGEAGINEMLEMALPQTRFFFNMSPQPLDEARATLERLREKCPRR